MPKYKPRYAKKKYYKKTLSKSNIFKNKSAKSQAGQIYSINKRIKYIQKVTAPEIQRIQDNLINRDFTDVNHYPITHYNSAISIYKDYLLNAERDRHINMEGNILRARYLQLYGFFGCYSDQSLTGDWVPNPNYQLTARQPFTAYLRIIVCKLKKSCQAVPQAITQAPDEVIPENASYWDVKPISGPLITDLTSQLVVLKDKIIKVNPNNPMRMYKMRFTPKQLGYTYRRPPEGAQPTTVGSNELIIYYQYVCPNVLQYMNQEQQLVRVGPVCRFTMNINYGYVDQN